MILVIINWHWVIGIDIGIDNMICTMYMSIALDIFFLTGSKISNSKFLFHSFFIKNRRPQFELLHNITESTEADAHALTFQFDSKQLTQRTAQRRLP